MENQTTNLVCSNTLIVSYITNSNEIIVFSRDKTISTTLTSNFQYIELIHNKPNSLEYLIILDNKNQITLYSININTLMLTKLHTFQVVDSMSSSRTYIKYFLFITDSIFKPIFIHDYEIYDALYSKQDSNITFHNYCLSSKLDNDILCNIVDIQNSIFNEDYIFIFNSKFYIVIYSHEERSICNIINLSLLIDNTNSDHWFPFIIQTNRGLLCYKQQKAIRNSLNCNLLFNTDDDIQCNHFYNKLKFVDDWSNDLVSFYLNSNLVDSISNSKLGIILCFITEDNLFIIIYNKSLQKEAELSYKINFTILENRTIKKIKIRLNKVNKKKMFIEILILKDKTIDQFHLVKNDNTEKYNFYKEKTIQLNFKTKDGFIYSQEISLIKSELFTSIENINFEELINKNINKQEVKELIVNHFSYYLQKIDYLINKIIIESEKRLEYENLFAKQLNDILFYLENN